MVCMKTLCVSLGLAWVIAVSGCSTEGTWCQGGDGDYGPYEEPGPEARISPLGFFAIVLSSETGTDAEICDVPRTEIGELLCSRPEHEAFWELCAFLKSLDHQWEEMVVCEVLRNHVDDYPPQEKYGFICLVRTKGKTILATSVRWDAPEWSCAYRPWRWEKAITDDRTARVFERIGGLTRADSVPQAYVWTSGGHGYQVYTLHYFRQAGYSMHFAVQAGDAVDDAITPGRSTYAPPKEFRWRPAAARAGADGHVFRVRESESGDKWVPQSSFTEYGKIERSYAGLLHLVWRLVWDQRN